MIVDPLTSNIKTTASGINQTAINLEVGVLVGHIFISMSTIVLSVLHIWLSR